MGVLLLRPEDESRTVGPDPSEACGWAHGKKIEKVAWNGAAPQRTNPLYTAESNHEQSEVAIILLKRWFSNATTTTRVFYQDSPCDHFSFSALVQYFLLELYLIFYLRELGDLLHSGFRYPFFLSCMIILLNYILLYIILNNLSIQPRWMGNAPQKGVYLIPYIWIRFRIIGMGIILWRKLRYMENIVRFLIYGIIADTIWLSPRYHARPYQCKIWPTVIIFAHRWFFGPLISTGSLEYLIINRAKKLGNKY